MEFNVVTGLNNFGNTCFMNSALQIIIHCDKLTDVLLSHNFSNKLSHVYKNFLLEYQKGKVIAPNELKSVIGNKFKIFKGTNQQDSHEFMINFLDFLDDNFKLDFESDNNKNIIPELFDCTVKTITKSLTTNEQSSKEDPVRFLCVSILPDKKNITLEDCLNNFIGNNNDIIENWEAPSKNHVSAKQTHIITKFPKYLIFQIKRYSFGNGKGEKLNADVIVRETWKCDLFPDNIYYELKGFIFQSGSLNGGHYVSYVKIKGTWYCCNDSNISIITVEFAIKLASQAYLLFYESKLYNGNSILEGGNTNSQNTVDLTVSCNKAYGNTILSKKDKRKLKHKSNKRKIYVLTL